MMRINQGNTMNNFTKDLRVAAIIGFVFMLPLAILEALNNTISKENLPDRLLLFGLLWLLPTVFIVILMPVLRSVRGNKLANPITFVLRVAVLALIAMVWGWGFVDQLPCFLGVPNCD